MSSGGPHRLSFEQARMNLANVEAFSLWNVSRRNKRTSADDPHLAKNRFAEGIIFPAVDIHRRIDPASRFYAIGSCFAREIEVALAERGLDVTSRAKNIDDEVEERADRPTFMNRYTTYAMLNDVAAAFGVRPFDERSIVQVDVERDQWVDLDAFGKRSHGLDEAKRRRAALQDVVDKLATSQTVVLTLGLNEAWFDKKTGRYTNISPDMGNVFERYGERFELHVLGYEENMAALDEIYQILSSHIGASCQIILTISPVPLTATYSGRDVVVANMYSKSVLRACADTWVRQHPEQITYFPSYEMAMLSQPDLVWMDDRAHVRADFVRQITGHFVDNCLAGSFQTRVVERQSLDSYSLFVTGKNQFGEQRWSEAVRSFRSFLTAAADAPDMPGEHTIARAKQYLIRSLISLRRPDEALATIDAYPDVVVHKELLALLYEQKQNIPPRVLGMLINAIIGVRSPSCHQRLERESSQWGKPDGWYVEQLRPDIRENLAAWRSRRGISAAASKQVVTA